MPPARPTKNKKDKVYKRDKGICQYCGEFVERDRATFDHRVPRSQTGRSTLENLFTCCYPCNKVKKHMPEEEFKKKLREGGVRWRDAELRRMRQRRPINIGIAVDRGEDG